MNIVESFSAVQGDMNEHIKCACLNIKTRFDKIDNAKALPNVDDYGHGASYELPYCGLNILVHHYRGKHYEQYELSIEYEII